MDYRPKLIIFQYFAKNRRFSCPTSKGTQALVVLVALIEHHFRCMSTLLVHDDCFCAHMLWHIHVCIAQLRNCCWKHIDIIHFEMDWLAEPPTHDKSKCIVTASQTLFIKDCIANSQRLEAAEDTKYFTIYELLRKFENHVCIESSQSSNRPQSMHPHKTWTAVQPGPTISWVHSVHAIYSKNMVRTKSKNNKCNHILFSMLNCFRSKRADLCAVLLLNASHADIKIVLFIHQRNSMCWKGLRHQHTSMCWKGTGIHNEQQWETANCSAHRIRLMKK